MNDERRIIEDAMLSVIIALLALIFIVLPIAIITSEIT